MAQLLRLDASSRSQGSHSRSLADFFQSQWMAAYPETKVIVRDVTQPAVPHVDAAMIQAFQTPADQRTADMRQTTTISDELLVELKGADYLLVSVPMYNFSVPSALKAWIDQIVRIGETFTTDGESFSGLLKTKKAFVCTAYGAAGYLNDGPMAGLNFLEPYLQGLFSFLGVQDIQFFALEGMMAGPEIQGQIKSATQAEVEAAIATLAKS